MESSFLTFRRRGSLVRFGRCRRRMGRHFGAHVRARAAEADIVVPAVSRVIREVLLDVGRETGGETVYDFFWMGELINEVDFNERLRDQARAIAKDIDSLQMGMDFHEAI